MSYNLAVGGATLDNNIVANPGYPYDVVSQVGLFESVYKSKPSYAPWSSSNAVFGSWIGVNEYASPPLDAVVSDLECSLTDTPFLQRWKFMVVFGPPELYICVGKQVRVLIRADIQGWRAQVLDLKRTTNSAQSFLGKSGNGCCQPACDLSAHTQ